MSNHFYVYAYAKVCSTHAFMPSLPDHIGMSMVLRKLQLLMRVIKYPI